MPPRKQFDDWFTGVVDDVAMNCDEGHDEHGRDVVTEGEREREDRAATMPEGRGRMIERRARAFPPRSREASM